jgi:hypothetical protein
MLNRIARKPSATLKESPSAALKPLTLVKRRLPKASVVFDTYWRFAVERQNILFRRLRGESEPWTADPILATYKFTNAYRAADRVSQYLIRHVIYSGKYDARDSVFRILLFKLFNKIETWQLLEELHGELTTRTFDIQSFDRILNAALAGGASIYSAAYIMPSGPVGLRQPRKHRMHLEMLRRLIKDRFADKLAAATSMSDAYELLRTLPGIGPFLAYQFVTDLNYSGHLNFSEMEFVMPGPGAHDGIRKCFTDLGDFSESDAIRWVAERQDREFETRGLKFRSLWGRPLQLIDCQNLFCEVDKYARVMHPGIAGVSGRTRIKQKFSAKLLPLQIWFPPKWGINADHPTTGPSLL